MNPKERRPVCRPWGYCLSPRAAISAPTSVRAPAEPGPATALTGSPEYRAAGIIQTAGGGQRNGMPLWTILGKPFDPARMDARPRLGSTEIWEITAGWQRTRGNAHPVHLHLVHFKVLSRNGRKPLPTDAGWKDTVDLTAGERARVIARFDGYRGRYVFLTCHFRREPTLCAEQLFDEI